MDLNKKYNLNSRIKLEEADNNHIYIIKLIKSRIIKKDAEKILETAKKIMSVEKNTKVSLLCTKNICSKSTAFLKENSIDIVYRDL